MKVFDDGDAERQQDFQDKRRMELEAHTPGPWTTDHTRVVPVYGSDGTHVDTRLYVNVGSSDSIQGGSILNGKRVQSEANARLIAAAPDMLAASKMLVASLEWEEQRSGTTYSGYEEIRAAITKAEGR